jgi:hypothetical protein
MVPSQLHVATRLGSSGFHATPIVTWSWHLSFLQRAQMATTRNT